MMLKKPSTPRETTSEIPVEVQTPLHDLDQNLVYELQCIYPLIWDLIGAACAQQVAHVFISNRVLFKDFALFLEKFSPLKSFPYLADVARLEWIQHQAFLAPHKRALTSDQLVFDPEEIPLLRFTPHPSLALFASPYPLEKIWGLTESSEKINLSSENSWALVVRPESIIEIYWLTCEEYIFFESLAEGHNLAQSAEKVLLLCPDFNFQEALQLAFAKSFFVATYLPFPRD